jgi:TolB protein
MNPSRLAWKSMGRVLGLLLAAAVAWPAGASDAVIAYCLQPVDGSGDHQIYVINLDGTGNRKLIDADIGLNHHSWSPDGSRLAAVGYIQDVENWTWSIYTFLADGTELTRVTATQGVWDSEPAWSPDGGRITFTRVYPDQDDREELWVMNVDGSDARWLGLTGFAAQWSPDGSRLVYAATRDGRRDLYTCAADGTDERRLANTEAVESFPAWSPDGSRIAFARSDDGEYGSWEIWVMNRDGSEALRLTENDAYDSYPKWSPDGSMIAFESDRSRPDHWEVYVMNADGSEVVRVTQLRSGLTAINPVWKPGTCD